MTKDNRVTHVGRVREAHKRNLRILKDAMPKADGLQLIIMKRVEEYHISRLHSLWFSTSRREKQC